MPEMLAPASLPQEQMLNSTSTVTLYAGSAGELMRPFKQ